MQTCELILRQLKPGAGIKETSHPVATLEELFAYCMSRPDLHLIDRLLLAGHDAQGQPRLLSFTFQSVADHKM